MDAAFLFVVYLLVNRLTPEDKVTKSVFFFLWCFLLFVCVCYLLLLFFFTCTSLSGGSDWPSLRSVIKLLSVTNKKDISLISEGKASFKADN